MSRHSNVHPDEAQRSIIGRTFPRVLEQVRSLSSDVAHTVLLDSDDPVVVLAIASMLRNSGYDITDFTTHSYARREIWIQPSAQQQSA